MPCHHPMRAWRKKNGALSLEKRTGNDDDQFLLLRCGNCIGCRKTNAQHWALRCTLELQQHTTAIAAHLTYDEKNLPITLQKRDLQLALKRLRRSATDRRIRFFACGEYGEKFGRPHYHAILYGLAETDRTLVDEAWRMGRVQTSAISPALISYIAGYVAKKYTTAKQKNQEVIDPETGEVIEWQEPFLQMSRRPGIGAEARKHTNSWRQYAIAHTNNSTYKISVPRYLHNAWRTTATKEQIEQLENEQKQISKATTTAQRLAQEQIDKAQIKLHAENRTL